MQQMHPAWITAELVALMDVPEHQGDLARLGTWPPPDEDEQAEIFDRVKVRQLSACARAGRLYQEALDAWRRRAWLEGAARQERAEAERRLSEPTQHGKIMWSEPGPLPQPWWAWRYR